MSDRGINYSDRVLAQAGLTKKVRDAAQKRLDETKSVTVLAASTMPTHTRGIGVETRYDVRKINDPTGEHADCGIFVLDPQHDPLSRVALAAYADAAAADHPALAADLRAWLRRVNA